MYKQLIMPLIATSSIASYCLMYTDDAINVPQVSRTANAQIAHNQAKEKNWVHSDTNYPKNVWFVMFWSIDNGDYQGLGHVALAFLDDNNSLQIHDSEVHRGAREIYTSLDDLYGWFGSVGTRMTFLGWSEGVDNVKIIDEIKAESEVKEVKIEVKADKTKEKYEMWKVYAFPFFVYKYESLNKNVFYRID